MKKSICITVLLMLVAFFGYGQGKVKDLFDKAEEYYNDDKLDSALIIFQQIVKKYPHHKSYSKAFYNVGYTAWRLKNYEVAIPTFEKILKSNFNDKEKGPGEGLMSEPYAIYKHRSCVILAEIYLDKLEYKKAIDYLVMADVKYPYQHFCGNEYAANDIYLSVQYSKCYAGLGQIDSAINILWDHVFYGGFASNEAAVEQMKMVLPLKYDQNTIVNELKNAEKRIVVTGEQYSEIATIEMFEHRLTLPEFSAIWNKKNISFDDFWKLEPTERFRLIYTDSGFYKAFIN